MTTEPNTILAILTDLGNQLVAADSTLSIELCSDQFPFQSDKNTTDLELEQHSFHFLKSSKMASNGRKGFMGGAFEWYDNLIMCHKPTTIINAVLEEMIYQLNEAHPEAYNVGLDFMVGKADMFGENADKWREVVKSWRPVS